MLGSLHSRQEGVRCGTDSNAAPHTGLEMANVSKGAYPCACELSIQGGDCVLSSLELQ